MHFYKTEIFFIMILINWGQVIIEPAINLTTYFTATSLNIKIQNKITNEIDSLLFNLDKLRNGEPIHGYKLLKREKKHKSDIIVLSESDIIQTKNEIIIQVLISNNNDRISKLYYRRHDHVPAIYVPFDELLNIELDKTILNSKRKSENNPIALRNMSSGSIFLLIFHVLNNERLVSIYHFKPNKFVNRLNYNITKLRYY